MHVSWYHARTRTHWPTKVCSLCCETSYGTKHVQQMAARTSCRQWVSGIGDNRHRLGGFTPLTAVCMCMSNSGNCRKGQLLTLLLTGDLHTAAYLLVCVRCEPVLIQDSSGSFVMLYTHFSILCRTVIYDLSKTSSFAPDECGQTNCILSGYHTAWWLALAVVYVRRLRTNWSGLDYVLYCSISSHLPRVLTDRRCHLQSLLLEYIYMFVFWWFGIYECVKDEVEGSVPTLTLVHVYVISSLPTSWRHHLHQSFLSP